MAALGPAAEGRRLDTIQACPFGYYELVKAFLGLLAREKDLAAVGRSFGVLYEPNLLYSKAGFKVIGVEPYEGPGVGVKHHQCMRSIFRVFCRVCNRWHGAGDWTFVAWRMLDDFDNLFGTQHQDLYLMELSDQAPHVYKRLMICIRQPRPLSV